MMLKKYIGKTTRDVLKKMREDLGEDAMVISTRQTADGVEMIAMPQQDIEQVAEQGQQLAATKVRSTAPPRYVLDDDRMQGDRQGNDRADDADSAIKPSMGNRILSKFITREKVFQSEQKPVRATQADYSDQRGSAASSASTLDKIALNEAARQTLRGGAGAATVSESQQKPRLESRQEPRLDAQRPVLQPSSSTHQHSTAMMEDEPTPKMSAQLMQHLAQASRAADEHKYDAQKKLGSASPAAQTIAAAFNKKNEPPSSKKASQGVIRRTTPLEDYAPHYDAPATSSSFSHASQDMNAQLSAIDEFADSLAHFQQHAQQQIAQMRANQQHASTMNPSVMHVAPASNTSVPPSMSNALDWSISDEISRYEQQVMQQQAVQHHQSPPITQPNVVQRPASSTTHATEMPKMGQVLLDELRSVKHMLSDQLSSLAWKDATTEQPLRARFWKEMTDAGFSPAFARTVSEKLPVNLTLEPAKQWLHQVLIRNLATVPSDETLTDKGGVYALVGPTGVGKTTTIAKLAARCVVKYGADAVGLISTDSYRIGAHDQLKIYGKILGVQVYAAHAMHDLQSVLNVLSRKKLVLIDTVGMSQRDARVLEQIAMLSNAQVQRILLLSAAAHPETLDDVARGFLGANPRGQAGHGGLAGAIISKLDEATKIGGILDTLIRFKLPVQFVTNGQRVPEDLHNAHPQFLIHRAFKQSELRADDPIFAMQSNETQLAMSQAAMTQRYGEGGL
jgi:flagellar biosynthetic protein FlhF